MSYPFDALQLINQRQQQLLVHSFIYYQLGDNIIPDYLFDRWSNELASLQKRYPRLAKQSIYHQEFLDFEGGSGFNLPYHYPKIQAAGIWLLEQHRKQ